MSVPTKVPTCPACAAGPWQLQPDPGGELVFLCMGCGCIFNGGDRKHWYNLDRDITDPIPNDGWDGAAGCEIRDPIYEPYPHEWDYDLKWCRVRAAADSGLYHEMFEATQPGGKPRDVLDIPAWIVRRALVALPERYRERDIW